MIDACTLVRTYGPLVARILLAQLFIVSGIGKAMLFAKTAAYMTSMGLPASQILLVLTVLLEVGGGVLLLAGWRARWIATAFFCFTLVTTIVFHAFWSADAATFPGQLNNFMKNFAIMGGMLYVIAYGAGPLSVGRDECGTETNVETRPATRKPKST
jgi:putative oxidoreductase